MNKAILIGRLGEDPQIKYIPSGAAVSNFSMATKDRWQDKSGEWKESTSWHKVVVWRKLAEQTSSLSKGDLIIVFGKTHTRSWDSDQGKKYITEVIANEILKAQYLTDSQQATSAPPVTDYAPPVTDDDIPF